MLSYNMKVKGEEVMIFTLSFMFLFHYFVVYDGRAFAIAARERKTQLRVRVSSVVPIRVT